MHVARGWIPQKSLQPDLPGRGVHEVDSADHFADRLQAIVHDNGQLVGDEPVTPQDDEVTGFRFEGLALGSLQKILEHNRLVIGADPDGKFAAAKAIA